MTIVFIVAETVLNIVKKVLNPNGKGEPENSMYSKKL